MLWKHKISFTRVKGKSKATCEPCGKSSPLTSDAQEISAWVTKHTGIRERGKRGSNLGGTAGSDHQDRGGDAPDDGDKPA